MTDEKERLGVVPEWMIERLVAGDLPPERAVETKRRLAAEPGGIERMQRIIDSNAEILDAHPASVMAAEIERRLVLNANAAGRPAAVHPTRRPVGGWLTIVGVPTLAAAALTLILWSRPHHLDTDQHGPIGAGMGRRDDRQRDPDPDTDTIKGLSPSLRVYRKAADGIEPLAEAATTRAGDRLQLAYVAAGRRFGAVLSVDGAGHVTFHMPAAAGPAARLRRDGEVALPDAYELDAAPGFEKFVFVSGDGPFDTASLADVVRGKAAAPAGTTVVSLTVGKE